MSQLTKRIGTKAHKFAVELHLEKVQMDLGTSCKIKIAFNKGSQKVESKTLPALQNGVAYFDETLLMHTVLHHDTKSQSFLSKEASIVVCAVTAKGSRIVGHTRFDLANLVNDTAKERRQILPILECPDTKAVLFTTMRTLQIQELNTKSIDSDGDEEFLLSSRIHLHQSQQLPSGSTTGGGDQPDYYLPYTPENIRSSMDGKFFKSINNSSGKKAKDLSRFGLTSPNKEYLVTNKSLDISMETKPFNKQQSQESFIKNSPTSFASQSKGARDVYQSKINKKVLTIPTEKIQSPEFYGKHPDSARPHNRIDELEFRNKSLEKENRELLQRLNDLEAADLYSMVAILQKENQSLLKKKHELEDRLQNSNFKSYELKVAEYERMIQVLKDELSSGGKEDRALEVEKLKRSLAETEFIINHLKREKEETENKRLKDLTNLSVELQMTKSELYSSAKLLEDATKALGAKDNEIRILKQENQNIRSFLEENNADAVKKALAEAQKTIVALTEEKEAQQQSLQAEIARLKQENAALSSDFEILNMESVKKNATDFESAVAALKKENETLQTKFQTQIADLLKEKQKLEALLTESQQKSKDLEHERGRLAERQLELEKLLNEKTSKDMEGKEQKFLLERANFESKIRELIAEKEQLQKDYLAERDALVKEREESFEKHKEIIKALEENNLKLLNQNQSLEKEVQEGSADSWKQQINEIETKLKETSEEKRALGEEIERLKQQLKDAASDTEVLKKDNTALREQVDALTVQTAKMEEDYKTKIEELGAALDKLTKEQGELDNSLKQKISENEQLVSEIATLRQEIKNVNDLNERMKNKEEVGDGSKEQDKIVSSYPDLDYEVDDLKEENQILRKENDSLRKLYEQAKNDNKTRHSLDKKTEVEIQLLQEKIAKQDQLISSLQASLKEKTTPEDTPPLDKFGTKRLSDPKQTGEKKVKELEEKLKEAEEEVKRKTKEIEENQQVVSEASNLKILNEALRKRLQEMDKSQGEYESEMDTKTTKIASLEKTLKSYEKDLDSLRKENAQLIQFKTQIEEHENQSKQLVHEKNELLNKIEKLQQTLLKKEEEHHNEIQNLKSEIESLNQRLRELQEDLPKKLKSAEASKRKLEAQYQKLQAEFTTLKNEWLEADKQNAKLSANVQASEANEKILNSRICKMAQDLLLAKTEMGDLVSTVFELGSGQLIEEIEKRMNKGA